MKRSQLLGKKGDACLPGPREEEEAQEEGIPFSQQEGEQEKAGWRPGTVRPSDRDFQHRIVDDFKTIDFSHSGCFIC